MESILTAVPIPTAVSIPAAVSRCQEQGIRGIRDLKTKTVIDTRPVSDPSLIQISSRYVGSAVEKCINILRSTSDKYSTYYSPTNKGDNDNIPEGKSQGVKPRVIFPEVILPLSPSLEGIMCFYP